jgi:hypothetical protein
MKNYKKFHLIKILFKFLTKEKFIIKNQNIFFLSQLIDLFRLLKFYIGKE